MRRVPVLRAESPRARSGEPEATITILCDLFRAGRLRPLLSSGEPLPWPAFVKWFKREHAPGLWTPALSAALCIALGPPTPAELGVTTLADRSVRPAELCGDAMLARLVSHSCRSLRAAPAGAFERLPYEVLETACAYGSLCDWLSLRGAARRFARVGQPFVRGCAAALARADLRPVHTLIVWAVRLYGPWQSVRAQRLANQLASTRAGVDRGALYSLWVRGQWDVWLELAPFEGGSLESGPVRKATIRALRLRVVAARSAAQTWLHLASSKGLDPASKGQKRELVSPALPPA